MLDDRVVSSFWVLGFVRSLEFIIRELLMSVIN